MNEESCTQKKDDIQNECGPVICPDCKNMTYIFDYGHWFCPVCRIDELLDNKNGIKGKSKNYEERYTTLCSHCNLSVCVTQPGRWICPGCNNEFTC